MDISTEETADLAL